MRNAVTQKNENWIWPILDSFCLIASHIHICVFVYMLGSLKSTNLKTSKRAQKSAKQEKLMTRKSPLWQQEATLYLLIMGCVHQELFLNNSSLSEPTFHFSWFAGLCLMFPNELIWCYDLKLIGFWILLPLAFQGSQWLLLINLQNMVKWNGFLKSCKKNAGSKCLLFLDLKN